MAEPGAEAHATTIVGPDSRPPAGSGSAVGPAPPHPDAIGPYRVTGEIGRGGMGVVYKALDGSKPVAIKMVLDPRHATGDSLRRFEREARAAIKLRHPNIVAVHATGMHEGRPFLVMDLIEGESFESLLRRGPMSARQAIELVRAIALALDHAHAAGVVHRDLKPENILVDRDGKPFLTDFGLARDQADRDNLTTTGTVLGTPAYMAPEQAGGETHEQGPHSDIYGLGAVLYRALSGQPPFQASTVTALMKKVLFDSVAPPSRLNPAVPAELDAIVLRCLSKRPAFRYPSGAALAEELRRFVAGEQIQERPALAFHRRHPRLAVALVLSLIFAGAAAAWLGLVALPAERRADANAFVASGTGAAKENPIGALDALDRAIALDPQLARAWHERGRVKLAIFDLEGALADLTRALELDSRSPGAWLDRAAIHLEKRELDASISDASRAIALAPKDGHGWLARGRARRLKKDFERAEDDLHSCMALYPEYSPDPVYQTAGRELSQVRSGR